MKILKNAIIFVLASQIVTGCGGGERRSIEEYVSQRTKQKVHTVLIKPEQIIVTKVVFERNSFESYHVCLKDTSCEDTLETWHLAPDTSTSFVRFMGASTMPPLTMVKSVDKVEPLRGNKSDFYKAIREYLALKK